MMEATPSNVSSMHSHHMHHSPTSTTTGHSAVMSHMMSMSVSGPAKLLNITIITMLIIVQLPSFSVSFRVQWGDSVQLVAHRDSLGYRWLRCHCIPNGLALWGSQILSRVPLLEDVQFARVSTGDDTESDGKPWQRGGGTKWESRCDANRWRQGWPESSVSAVHSLSSLHFYIGEFMWNSLLVEGLLSSMIILPISPAASPLISFLYSLFSFRLCIVL